MRQPALNTRLNRRQDFVQGLEIDEGARRPLSYRGGPCHRF